MFYYTYVLKCSDGKLYVGCTANLKNRVKDHKNGLVKSTKTRIPVELIYYEACTGKINAYRREKYFKSGFGRRFLSGRI